MIRILLAAALFASACSTPESAEPGEVSSPPISPAPSTATDWRVRVHEDVAALQRDNATLYAELRALQPEPTRAGFARFTSPAIHAPRATSVLIDRLAHGSETDEVRAALADALPRSGGRYADAMAELFTSESATTVRAAYVHAARRAPAGEATRLLALGFADPVSDVRAEAVRATGARPDGAQFASELQAALGTSDPTLRSEAARSLGVLKIAAARDALRSMLVDPAPEVRLEALRALDRIQPGAARDVAARLAADPDPRISALAARLATTR